MKSIVLSLGVFVVATASVFANPTGGTVTAGSASITSAGSNLTINQTSNRAIINWQGFSIANGELTQFIQPGASSAVLNRVTGGNLSSIYGTLKANGQVYLINPNGIVVGASGVIDTQGFVASTLDASDSEFLSGGNMTLAGDSSAKIQNLGKIDGGMGNVFLIARQIENAGTIQGKTVGLAAGTEVLLKPAQGDFIVKAGEVTEGTGIDNQGLIQATTAKLEAAEGNVYSLAINNGGVINANSVTNEGGKIYLRANGGKIVNTGKLIAYRGANGGDIDVRAGNIFIAPGAELRADATVDGNGGTVNVIAEDTAEFHGNISAKGAGAGNGGFVEVSGKHVDISGMVDTSAENGNFGTFLIDPGTVNVINSDLVLNGPDTFGDAWIASILELTNLTIQTSAASGGLGADENIVIFGSSDLGGAVDITWGANTKFELQAGRSIEMHSGALIENTSTTHSGDAIVMRANEAGSTSGNFIGVNIDGGTLRSNTGNIKLYGQGGDTGNFNIGVQIANGAVVESVGTGASAANISITGTSDSGDLGLYGVSVAGTSATRITTIDGDVLINGQGGNGINQGNVGILIGKGKVESIGTGSSAGKITLIGTGGTGNEGTHGVIVQDATVSSIDGDILLKGQGGSGAGAIANTGVAVAWGGKVQSTGTGDDAANITLIGTGGMGDNGTYGVYMVGNDSEISTVDGDILLKGKGGNSTGNGSSGITIENSAYVKSLGLGTNAGKITLIGTAGSGVSSNHGIYINAETNPASVTSIDGNISITGQAGGDGTGTNNIGVYVANGGTVESVGTGASAATITIKGTGGNGTDFNHGVSVDGGAVRSTDGNIAIYGKGNGTGYRNNGIWVIYGGKVASIGTGAEAANILLKGTGGDGNWDNNGVRVSYGDGAGTGASVDTVDGDISIYGKGGDNAAAWYNFGVQVNGNTTGTGRVTSTGDGKITIRGTGGNGDAYGCGVYVAQEDCYVSSVNGNITIYGTGANTGKRNYGVYMINGGQIMSTGVGATAANITIRGTGGNGTSENFGVSIMGLNSKISTIDGDISITGQGGNGSGDLNDGIRMHNSAFVESTGTGDSAGKITMNGTGGHGGSTNNSGVLIQVNSSVSSIDGDVIVRGTGGDGNSAGVWLYNGGSVGASGDANVTITGVGNGTTEGIKTTGATANSIGGTTTGYIILTADTMRWDNLAISGAGKLYVQPYNVGTSIGLGDGAVGTLNLTDAEMDSIADGFNHVTIGHTNGFGLVHISNLIIKDALTVRTPAVDGDMIVDSGANISWDGADQLELIAGRSIDIESGVFLENTSEDFNATDRAIYMRANTAGASTGSFNGITNRGTIAANTGKIELTGRGGNVGSDNYGVAVIDGGQIISTGEDDEASQIVLRGTGGAGDGYNYGVYVANGSSVETTDGDILMVGRGGAGTGERNIGVRVGPDAGVYSDGDGHISMYGTGGTGTDRNYGILIDQAEVYSQDGNINLVGQGGNGTGDKNIGTWVYESVVASEGSGNVTLKGTGGAGVNENYGVHVSQMYGNNPYVYTTNGNLTVVGKGNGTGISNFGVWFYNATVGSVDNGNVSITGTGGNGTDHNYGVLFQSSEIGSYYGNVSVRGQGNGTGSENVGVWLHNATNIGSDTGNITITGTGANGTDYNYGVYANSIGVNQVTTGSGNIKITGKGGDGSGSDNYGIGLCVADISTDSGNISMYGTGGNGTANNYGVALYSDLTNVHSDTGDILIRGQGKGAVDGYNHGIYLLDGGSVYTTGSGVDAGKITMYGTGSGDTTSYGVNISGAGSDVTTLDGNIYIKAKGGNNIPPFKGLYFDDFSQIQSTGSGTVTLIYSE
ncbi:MAG: beta strand repeat-containing protein [Verrucomicrobiota bacterium]